MPVTCRFAAPTDVCLPTNAWLGGSALHVLDGPCQAALAALLGWNKVPRTALLVQQLHNLGNAFRAPLEGRKRPEDLRFAAAAAMVEEAAVDQPGTLTPDPAQEAESTDRISDLQTDVSIEHADCVSSDAETSSAADPAAKERLLLLQKVANAAHQLYVLLQHAISNGEADVVKSALQEGPSVWLGYGFVIAGNVAMSGHGQYRPYLHVLPIQLREFQELMVALGVSETCVISAAAC